MTWNLYLRPLTPKHNIFNLCAIKLLCCWVRRQTVHTPRVREREPPTDRSVQAATTLCGRFGKDGIVQEDNTSLDASMSDVWGCHGGECRCGDQMGRTTVELWRQQSDRSCADIRCGFLSPLCNTLHPFPSNWITFHHRIHYLCSCTRENVCHFLLYWNVYRPICSFPTGLHVAHGHVLWIHTVVK